MAGDDNETKHDALGSSEPRVDHKPLGPEVVDKAAADHDAATTPSTEWTASDARGPLNEAKPLSSTDAGFASAPDDHARTSNTTATETAAPGPIDRDTAERETTAPVPAHAASASNAGQAPRRGSLLPVAAGIVLGAVIGAGSACYVYTTIATDPSAEKIAALTSRVDGLDKKNDPQQALAPLRAALADLKTRVAANESAAKAAATNADAAKKTAQNEPQAATTDTTALAAKIAALETTVGALKQTGGGDDVKALQTKLAADETKIGALTSSLDGLQHQSATGADLKALQDKVVPLEGTTATLQKQDASTQSALQALQASQKNLEGKITSAPALAVVSNSLVAQIDRGLPFTAQVNALDSLGVEPAKIALLRQWSDQGVPSARVLAEKFEPLVDGLLAAPRDTNAPPSFIDRMKAGLGGLVSVHRVDDTGGDDIASRIARIKADLARDDVIAAVTTFNALPAEAKTPPQVSAWGALAKTHADALSTANAVQSSAIAALGPKKS